MDSVRAIHLNYGFSGYTDFKITEKGGGDSVPEPSTLMMFGSAALSGLGFIRMRRRRRQRRSRA